MTRALVDRRGAAPVMTVASLVGGSGLPRMRAGEAVVDGAGVGGVVGIVLGLVVGYLDIPPDDVWTGVLMVCGGVGGGPLGAAAGAAWWWRRGRAPVEGRS